MQGRIILRRNFSNSPDKEVSQNRPGVIVRQQALVSILALVAATVAHAEPDFTAAFRSYDTGGGAWGVAAADFDRDGLLDLAVANRSDNTVSVVLGNGTGSFRSKADFPTWSSPRGVIARDLNGDGELDLVTSSNSSAVTILIGAGDGTFQRGAPVLVRDGGDARTVAITDLNLDGRPDLLIASAGYLPGFFASLGRGDGTFFATYRLNVGGQPISVAAGDLNGDGSFDAVMGDGNSPGAVKVLLSNGDGTMQVRPDALSTINPKALSIADLDGDGKLDLVALSSDSELNGTIFVLKGNGNGSFGEPTSFGVGRFVSGTFALADVNGDARMDLLVPSWGTSRLNIFLGMRDLGFGPMTTLGTEKDPQSAAVGDLDGDGRADVITANLSPGTISVHMANGSGAYGSDQRIGVGTTPTSLVVRDLDQDGRPDLSLVNFSSRTVSVLLHLGPGAFQRHDYPTGEAPVRLAASDLDGDDRPDLAVLNYGRAFSVLHNSGNGSFTPGTTQPVPPDAGSLSVADLNRDGAPDVTVSSGNSTFACFRVIEFAPPAIPATEAGGLAVFLGNGAGGFSAGTTMRAGVSLGRVAAGDLNGDGIPDLAATDWKANKVFLAFGRGDGTFDSPTELADLLYATSIEIADLDRNGIEDLVVGRSDPCGMHPGGITWFLGQGGGSFQMADSVPTPGSFDLATGDLNGDGNLDLVSANISNTVSVLFGNGDGTFQPKTTFGTGRNPTSVAMIDVDDDGRMDLAVADGFDNTVSILRNIGPSLVRSARVLSTDRTIPIGPTSPALRLVIEPIGRSFDVSDVDRSNVWMSSEGTGSVNRIRASFAKRGVITDSDGNGVPELDLRFTGEDLFALFSAVHGKRTIRVAIDGEITGGARFHATVPLTIVRTGGPHHAFVSPNPVLTAGALRVTIERPGPLKANLYNADGRLIRVIADVPMASAGDHSFVFDRERVGVPSGVYFYRVESADGRQAGKFVIAK